MTEQEAITRLRTMTATDETSHTDATMQEYLANALVKDSAGVEPGGTDYVPTWDVHRAASLVWLDKAGALARTAFDLQTDMTKANRSGQINNAWKMYRLHAAKAIPKIVGFDLVTSASTATGNVTPDA